MAIAPRYERADGGLIDREPTGPREAVGGELAVKMGGDRRSPFSRGKSKYPFQQSLAQRRLEPWLFGVIAQSLDRLWSKSHGPKTPMSQIPLWHRKTETKKPATMPDRRPAEIAPI